MSGHSFHNGKNIVAAFSSSHKKKKKKKKKYSDPWIWEQQIRTESRKKSRIVISWREHNCQEVSHSTDMLHPATCKLTVEGHTVSFWILKKDVIFFILFSWRAYSFIQLLCVNSWWKYLGYHFESYFYAVLSSSSVFFKQSLVQAYCGWKS